MAGRPHILIIASRGTREVDGVVDRLRLRGFEITRFSPCQYPGKARHSWRPGTGIDNFSAAAAAWLVDFSGWSVEASLTGLEREIALAEVTAFVDGMLLALETNWLNDPATVRSSSRKLFQLQIVARLGIPVPVSCVTNDPSEAIQFCADHGEVIAKALATGFITYGAQTLKLYTRSVDTMATALFDGLASGPLIFQRRVPKAEEIRAIVVDEQVFLVRADLRGLENEITDIRTLDYQVERARFGPCDDRRDLAQASLNIVRALNLSYGCIDWAIEADGSAVFLECNPLGSFKWFELCGGEDISGHLADALERRCAK